jgi:hypothetical protein
MPRGISITANFESWNPEVLYIMVSVANRRAAEHVVKTAKQNLSSGGHNDTSNLTNSFRITESRFGLLGAEAEITNDAPYARWVDEGTADRIYPLYSPVLVFKPGKRKPRAASGRFVSNTSSTVFAKYVKGQQATHFFTNAVESLSIYNFL